MQTEKLSDAFKSPWIRSSLIFGAVIMAFGLLAVLIFQIYEP
jgi:hypothetical protein